MNIRIILVYLFIQMNTDMKKHKTRFKQLEFQPDYLHPRNYLVVVELDGNTPKASYTVRVPEAISPFQKFQHFSN
jgi:hypothetical protein